MGKSEVAAHAGLHIAKQSFVLILNLNKFSKAFEISNFSHSILIYS